MKPTYFLLVVCSLFISACISVDVEATPTFAPLNFVTATLAPTKAGYVMPTATPMPAITLTPTLAVTIDPNCQDSAILVRDVTVPDGTVMKAGETFTKTWEFINNGSCPWYGYVIKFAAGDAMNAPQEAAVPVTLLKDTVQVSVQLTAPTVSGSYTGYFTLNNSNGRDVPIGIEKTFWVNIKVGSDSVGVVQTAVGTPVAGGSSVIGMCSYSQNAGYVDQIATLINAERIKAGLPALPLNATLAGAAQTHAGDMACNSSISHTGSDGSSAYVRVLSSGYTGSFTEEIIYGGGGPQAALNWWMNDQIHREAILNPRSSEMGVGYAYFANGSYGDYIVVDFGR